jgi:cardiolipin synthase
VGSKAGGGGRQGILRRANCASTVIPGPQAGNDTLHVITGLVPAIPIPEALHSTNRDGRHEAGRGAAILPPSSDAAIELRPATRHHHGSMTIPNIITIGRLIIVPIVIVMIMQQRWSTAFVLFVVAGISDGVDGFIARKFDMRSEFGAYIDPIADKALLVSIYVTLAIVGAIPGWLAIVIVSRDVMIVTAVLLSWVMSRPVEIKPLLVSKLNTAAQIAFAAFALSANAFGVDLAGLEEVAMVLVATLTIASAGAYLVGWLRHMTT